MTRKFKEREILTKMGFMKLKQLWNDLLTEAEKRILAGDELKRDELVIYS